jgi:hypothetical protein
MELNYPIFESESLSTIDSAHKEFIEQREEELQLRDAAFVEAFWRQRQGCF